MCLDTSFFYSVLFAKQIYLIGKPEIIDSQIKVAIRLQWYLSKISCLCCCLILGKV